MSKRQDNEYKDLPEELIHSGFDPADRKFAALANKAGVPVVNATDSDWIEAAQVLQGCGIQLKHLCGTDKTTWYE